MFDQLYQYQVLINKDNKRHVILRQCTHRQAMAALEKMIGACVVAWAEIH